MFSAQELYDARRSHARHYLRQLRIADALYQKGGPQIVRSLAKFDQDWPQIAQGQAWAARASEDAQAARLCCEFTQAGADLLTLRQAVPDRIGWHESVLAAARRIGWREIECETLIHLGRAYWASGDVNEAAARLELALQIATVADFPARLARAHQALGELRASQSEHDAAREHCKTALSRFERLADQRGIADALQALGNLALIVDDYPEADRLLRRSLALYQTLGDRIGEARALARLGSLAGTQRDFLLAEQYFATSHAIYAELNHLEGLGQALNMLGTVAVAMGNFTLGRARLEESLTVHERLGNQDGIAACLMKLGEIDQYTGQYEQAAARYQAALGIYQAMKNLYNVAGVAFRLGNLALSVHDEADAERWFRRSAELCRAIDRPLLAASLSGLAQIACGQGRYDEAARYFSEGLAEALARGDAWIVADIHQEWANMALALHDTPAAREHLRQALDTAMSIGAVPLALSILRSVVRLLTPEQPETALAVASFVMLHPASLQDDKDELSPLITALEAYVSPQRCAAIQAEAKDASLEATVAQVRL
ncbi:MAG: tetratricopeptide repeat protein [Anaerolineae bacterium]|nr:tetratricopeptide repeat protein [Anaerolineae bacterium]